MLEGKVPLRSGKPKAGGSTPGATNSLGKCLAPALLLSAPAARPLYPAAFGSAFGAFSRPLVQRVEQI